MGIKIEVIPLILSYYNFTLRRDLCVFFSVAINQLLFNFIYIRVDYLRCIIFPG